MSRIDRLSVLGIRSFDVNGGGETIQFNTPLTLIVGHNGSGKTTIIESLKYATTGQLPPNSKGGAFIHDPTLNGDKEALAQVKLMFKDAQGSSLTMARSLSLTIKKTGRTQKTLECSISMKKDGERRVLSTKVGQLDSLMQEYLGVSEAVLDSVIFCHQDESLWPMSEPATLKKKFDEIFDAGQYTKAIDKIRKMRKEQGTVIKLHELEAGHTKTMKDRAEKSEKRAVALQNEIEDLKKQVIVVEDQMGEAKASAKEKLNEAEGYHGILGELTAKRVTQEERQKNLDELRPNLKELPDSDDILQEYLSQYQERMALCDQELVQHEQQLGYLTKKVSDSRSQHAGKLSQQGQLEAEKRGYDRQLSNRIELVKDSASRHRFRGYEGKIEDYQIQEFIEKMSRAVRDKQRELTRAREEKLEATEKASAALKEIEDRIAAQKREKESAKGSIKANDLKIKALQHDMDRIQVDEDRKATLDSACQQLEIQLETANSEFEKAEWASTLDKERKLQGDLDAKIQKLTDEQNRINKLATQRGELEHVKKQLKVRQKALETTTVTYGGRITTALGPNWKPETLEEEFNAEVEERSSTIAEARSLRDGTNAELSHITDQCKTLRENLSRKLAERDSCEQQVRTSMEDLTSIEDYESQLAELEETRLNVKMEIENVGHLKNFWNSALKHVQIKNKCHVCEHKFSGEPEKSVAVNHIRKKMMDSEQETWEKELESIEEQLVGAHAARPRYDTYRRLSNTEIPAIRNDLKKADAKREDAVARLEKQDLSVEEEEASRGDLKDLGKYVADIVRYTKEITSFSKNVEDLSSQPEISSSMSMDEIRSQLESYSEQMRAINTKINNLIVSEQRATKEISDLKFKLVSTKGDLEKATHQLEKKNGFAQQIRELRDITVDLRATIKLADNDLDALAPQADKAREEQEDVRRTCEKKENKIQDDLSNLSMTDSKLKDANREIDTYIRNGGSDKLAECQQVIKEIEDKIQKHKEELSQIQKAIAELKEQRAHGEENKRSITDNINYRKNLRALEVLNVEIARLESTNADEDYDRLTAEANAFEQTYQVLNANRGTLLGELRAKDKALGDMVAEWESDFKDAGSKYREALIKVEATKAAIGDLGKYGTALEKAVIMYHSMKMEEINRIAGDLWQSTYQGTDVDTILIRSDNENAKGSRNFNYRVCMVKSEVEMDMRGRCSAGQRVLASIIIRLALAECFGVNCGIIALDEPTTNLDQDNIRSLAQSLHDIIEARRVQKNFQLIVITHDEEFLKAMKCGSFCDNYWRISRDDKQKSIIRMQSIKEVLG